MKDNKKIGKNAASKQAQRRQRQQVGKLVKSTKVVDPQPVSKKRTQIFAANDLKVIFLGGQDAIGAKNMVLIEFENDAVIVDCGSELGLDLPGVNYAIPDISYLQSIRHKLRGYILTHGHLDHIGGLPHILPLCPAPIYGSLFTVGMVKKILANHAASAQMMEEIRFVEMNMDNHERLKLGKFTIELVRITHSIPECSCVIVDTPLGRIINTGDFRLDPEPLDKKPSDIARLKQLGKEGVLLLLSESTNAQMPDRTPTEHTLQASFDDIIKTAEGRIFVASFSSNINRIQMIINSAAAGGRKIAIDGRSMIQHVELAVKLGLLKVPQKTIVPLAKLASLPANQILMMCTGGQGETGAALSLMSVGDHRYINLKEGDTVVVSSKPIPGNIVAYDRLGDNLVKMGCRVLRAPTWELDGACGPLHVSGHGYRDEHREMIELTQPKYLAPIYAGAINRNYHSGVAVEQNGLKRDRILMTNNGDAIIINKQGKATIKRQAVAHGSVLVDDSGQIVPSVVIKDRLMLTENGLVVIILLIDKQNGQLLSSPDIVTRGFIYIRDNEELMNILRNELKRAVNQRFKRVPLDRFKIEVKDHAAQFLYNQTQRSPIIIPVINVVSKNSERQQSQADQQRFTELQAAIRSQRSS